MKLCHRRRRFRVTMWCRSTSATDGQGQWLCYVREGFTVTDEWMVRLDEVEEGDEIVEESVGVAAGDMEQ